MKHLALATALLTCAAPALSQSTLGELVDLGAVKLVTRAELAALGDLRLVRQAADADAYVALRTDGSVVGIVHNKQGSGSSEAIGTWSVDDHGRRCVDVDLPAFSMKWQQCGYTYRLGRDIFMAPSDTDRSASVTQYAGPAFLR